MKHILLAVVVLGVVIGALPCASFAEEPAFRGKVDLSYRYRSDGNETDQDMRQYLSLSYFRPWEKAEAEVGVVFAGMLQEDIDGRNTGEGFYQFSELADSYDSATMGWLYLAYAEISTRNTLELMRFGRQELMEFEPIAFDGALASARVNKKISIWAYGGVPVNLYETDCSGDSLIGSHVVLRPAKNLFFMVGYLGLRDEVKLADETETKLHDDLIFIRAFWRASRNLSLMTKSSLLDSEFRDASISATYRNYDYDFNLNVFYKAQFIEREAQTSLEDPFSLILGPYRPYHSGGVSAYKGIGEYFGVEAGAFFKQLFENDDESTYNHNYQRYLLSLFLYKVPFSKSEWVVGADYWVSPGDAETYTVRGEYSQKLGKRGRFKAGTSYDLYKVNLITGEEDEDVRTYYVGLLLPFGKHFYLGVDYRFEDGSAREVDTIETRVGYEF